MKILTLVSICTALACLGIGCSSEDDSTPPEPVASFTISGSLVTQAPITFSNTSTAADSFHWDFGNDSTSALRSPTIVYDEAADYLVTLTIIQKSTGRADTVRQTLMILPSSVQFFRCMVESMPFAAPFGGPWDETNGPDVYAAADTAGFRIWTSSPQEDVVPGDLPLSIGAGRNFHFTDFSTPHRLTFIDDDGSGFSQVIGTVDYTYQDIIDDFGYVEEVVIEGSSVELHVRLVMRWH